MNKNKILVVDDEIKIVEVVKAYLEKDNYEVFIATDGKSALKSYDDNKQDLIILDLMLPDITGEEVCKILREKSDVPIIMLTAKVDEENILNGFNIGTDDYVIKPFSPKQLIARVNAIIKRVKNNKSKLSFNNGDLIIDKDSYEVFKNNNLITLTPSEYKILLQLAENKNKVFTRGDIISKTMEDDSFVYDRIVDSHIKNIRAKIEDDNKKPKYILTVHGIGYKFGGD
ncbi:response regulator transcription factor [Clostridium sp.]|uniref:response regulator transcription factor n=1 Tax=Clostridium sp. TaxID=1506 RepID=UPI0026DB90BC|nr:response regulator transcription factor [Clostridium sp.]MDO5040185.1 response regulator transcription factor [Clostridium sp.]